MSSKVIDVVAGIIYNSDQSEVLLSLRKPEQHQGNCWEFPGGKIEEAESHQEALARELNEELGIEVVDSKAYCEIQHDYKDKRVRLYFWQVTRFGGVPEGRENQQLAWVGLSDLVSLEFPEANRPVVERLMRG